MIFDLTKFDIFFSFTNLIVLKFISFNPKKKINKVESEIGNNH